MKLALTRIVGVYLVIIFAKMIPICDAWNHGRGETIGGLLPQRRVHVARISRVPINSWEMMTQDPRFLLALPNLSYLCSSMQLMERARGGKPSSHNLWVIEGSVPTARLQSLVAAMDMICRKITSLPHDKPTDTLQETNSRQTTVRTSTKGIKSEPTTIKRSTTEPSTKFNVFRQGGRKKCPGRHFKIETTTVKTYFPTKPEIAVTTRGEHYNPYKEMKVNDTRNAVEGINSTEQSQIRERTNNESVTKNHTVYVSEFKLGSHKNLKSDNEKEITRPLMSLSTDLTSVASAVASMRSTSIPTTSNGTILEAKSISSFEKETTELGPTFKTTHSTFIADATEATAPATTVEVTERITTEKTIPTTTIDTTEPITTTKTTVPFIRIETTVPTTTTETTESTITIQKTEPATRTTTEATVPTITTDTTNPTTTNTGTTKPITTTEITELTTTTLTYDFKSKQNNIAYTSVAPDLNLKEQTEKELIPKTSPTTIDRKPSSEINSTVGTSFITNSVPTTTPTTLGLLQKQVKNSNTSTTVKEGMSTVTENNDEVLNRDFILRTKLVNKTQMEMEPKPEPRRAIPASKNGNPFHMTQPPNATQTVSDQLDRTEHHVSQKQGMDTKEVGTTPEAIEFYQINKQGINISPEQEVVQQTLPLEPKSASMTIGFPSIPKHFRESQKSSTKGILLPSGNSVKLRSKNGETMVENRWDAMNKYALAQLLKAHGVKSPKINFNKGLDVDSKLD